MPKLSQREKKGSQRKKSSSTKPAGQGGRGRPPWTRGSKLAFLERWLPDYRKIAGNKGAAKGFYNKIAWMFIIKYGYDLPIDQDALEVLEDPDEAALDDMSEYGDGDEVEQARRDAFKCEVHCRISSWYSVYIRRLPAPTDVSSASNDTFAALIEEIVQPPHRQQVIQVYCKQYWLTKIAPRYEQLLRKANARDARAAAADDDYNDRHADHSNEEDEEDRDDSGTGGSNGSDGKAEGGRKDIHLRMRAVREMWAEETDVVKAEVKAAVEDAYDAAMEDYKARYLQIPMTDEDREWTSGHVYMFLQPIVDMVATRFNCAASLFIAGPVPSKDGHVEVHSVHAGKKQGAIDELWPQHDRAAYEVVAESMAGFAWAAFAADILRMAQNRTKIQSDGGAAPISGCAPAGSNSNTSLDAGSSGSVLTLQHANLATGPAQAVSPDTQLNPSLPTVATTISKTAGQLNDVSPRNNSHKSSGASPITSLDSTVVLGTSGSYSSSRSPSSTAPPRPSSTGSHRNVTTSHDTAATSHDAAATSNDDPSPNITLQPDTHRIPDATSPGAMLAGGLTLDALASTRAQAEELTPESTPSGGPHSRDLRPSTPALAALTASRPTVSHTVPVSPIGMVGALHMDPATLSTAAEGRADLRASPATAMLSTTAAPHSTTLQPSGIAAASQSLAHRGWLKLFDQGVMKMRSAPLGPDWQVLVTRYSGFEEAMSFGEGPSESLALSAKHRPEEVRLWQKGRRPWHNGKIKNLDDFMNKFEDWWRSLQPAERFDSEGDAMAPSISMDWSKVCIAGPNGLLSVLAALLWWGLAVKDDKEHYAYERWYVVVVDVSTVLFITHKLSVARALEAENAARSDGLKRSAKDDPSDSKLKKRCTEIVNLGARAGRQIAAPASNSKRRTRSSFVLPEISCGSQIWEKYHLSHKG
ncbi:hypothetical protein FA95DRAFT_1578033 [Auriscalpium vulgare]|uniref:Uncharacterized protein n=1 Tax=Auriscalpium vulgare TaxID=40419 RepID=A0ACB8R3M4_9AGAM|nr:hypothetical protein FA95DRAFT_1578033 [Auriscalpium vulgare]